MPEQFGEITLSKADLEEALQVLEKGCTGTVSIVFADSKMIGVQKDAASEGFAIAPKSTVCLYGCKDKNDIQAAINSQKGVVREKC